MQLWVRKLQSAAFGNVCGIRSRLYLCGLVAEHLCSHVTNAKRESVSGNGTLRMYTCCDILPWWKASANNFVWHRFLMVLPLSLISVPSHDCSSHLFYKGGASSDLFGLPNTTAASFHPGGSCVPRQCCLHSMDHVQKLMSTSQVLNSCFAPWIFHQFRFWDFLINGSFAVFAL